MSQVTAPGPLRYMLDRFCPRLHKWLTVNIRAFEEPPELRALNEYLRRLSSSIAQDIADKTYVPLSAKDLIDGDRVAQTRRHGFLTPVHQLIREVIGVAEGGDALSAQISAVSKKSRLVRNIVARLECAVEPLVLLGEPGSGKSLTLKQTAMLIAERESRRVYPSICVFVRLGEFHESFPDDRSVFEHVRRSADAEIAPLLEQLDATGRLIIFFDGMDEMSREQYTEHTRALSVFAGSRKGNTKTLFSCRITDFTPEFKHNRLVLLPFDAPQIRQYVTRHIPHFPVTIAGQRWSARQLSKRLAAGGLPMQASNPFVLWLLCFYLLEHEEWPASRVELLRFYNEINWRRKEAEAQRDGHAALPNRDRAFLTWGKIAFEITTRNQGTVIPLSDLQELLDDEERDHLEAGKYCGVFQESLDLDQTLIRFEHHRFQEYFTAYFIKERALRLEWLDKLDAPRWQETLVNLALMGGGTEALTALNDVIAGAKVTQDEDGDTTDALDLGHLDALARSLLSDRIELASRVVKHCSSTADLARDELKTTFRHATYWLAEHGNPVEQVRMLEAAQNDPEIETFEVARAPLGSNVEWARNHALIATSRASAKSSQVLPLDIMMNFAGGRFLSRLKSYVTIAASLKQTRLWFVLFAGVALMLGQILGIGAMVFAARSLTVDVLERIIAADERAVDTLVTTPQSPLGTEGVPAGAEAERERVSNLPGSNLEPSQSEVDKRRTKEELRLANQRTVTLLNSTAFKYCLCAVLMLSATYCIVSNPEHLLQGIFYSGMICVGLPWVGYTMWHGQPGAAIVFVYLVVGMSGGIVNALFAGFLLGIHLVSTLAFLQLVRALTPVRPFSRLLVHHVWGNSSYSEWMKSGASYLFINLCSWGVSIVIALSLISIDRITGTRGSFSSRFSGAVLSLCLIFFAFDIAVCMIRGIRLAGQDRLNLAISFCVRWIFVAGFVTVVVASAFFVPWLFNLQGNVVGPVLAVVLVTVIAVPILMIAARLVRVIGVKMAKPTDIARGMSAKQWKEKIAKESPVGQEALLRATTCASLGLSIEQFLLLLVELEATIEDEPALSAYWSKRAELEQTLRQHRTG